MRTLPLLLSAALLVVTTTASAQWMWVDKDGRKVFSDRAPPSDIPAKNVLRQPGMAPRTQIEDSPAAKPSQAGVSSSGDTTSTREGGKGALDKVVEERKRQAEAAAQQKQQAEEAKAASAKSDNCARARQNLTTLQSGIRIAQVNEGGERSYLDDQARSAELARAQSTISSDCQ